MKIIIDIQNIGNLFMNKTVILSTNDDLNYKSYLPYIQKAWNLLGWKTLTFYLGEDNIISDDKNKIIKIYNISGYREATIVQTSRLLGYQYIDEGIIMTSDVDMMPLSNYWNPDYDKITCYGYDLTNFKHFPICYIAANSSNWRCLFGNQNLEHLLSKYPSAHSNKFKNWWFVDQEIVTQKLLEYPEVISISRGLRNNLAVGRIDRVRWIQTRYDDTKKIDAHMPRPFCEECCLDLIDNILKPNLQ